MIKIANYNAFLKSKLMWCPAINACTNLTKIFKRGEGCRGRSNAYSVIISDTDLIHFIFSVGPDPQSPQLDPHIFGIICKLIIMSVYCKYY